MYNNRADKNCTNCYDTVSECECGDTETFSSYGVVCPYCGHRTEDDLEGYEDGSHDWECASCEKPFNLDVSVSVSWSGTKHEQQEVITVKQPASKKD